MVEKLVYQSPLEPSKGPEVTRISGKEIMQILKASSQEFVPPSNSDVAVVTSRGWLIFNYPSGEVKERSSLKEPIPLKGVKTIVGVFKEMKAVEIRELLSPMIEILPPGKRVFVLVKKRENSDKEKNEVVKGKEVLRGMGLVRRGFLVNQRGEFWILRGRTPKERKGVEVNLWEGPEWRKKWLKGLLREAIIAYQKEGFITVSYKEIEEKLKHSTFPLWDIGCLKLGFGFLLQSPCGCKWTVDLSGTWTRVRDCGDPDCDGLPKLQQERS